MLMADPRRNLVSETVPTAGFDRPHRQSRYGLQIGIASDASSGRRRSLGEATRLRVRFVELAQVLRGRAVDRGESLLHRLGDSQERQAPLEECRNGDLVRGEIGRAS